MNNIDYKSQYGQDKFLVEKYFNFKRNGYFVDLAAGDGIHLSNTYVLEHFLEWQGICIDANDMIYDKLKHNRKCICDNRCILDDTSTVNFKNIKNSTGWEHLLSYIEGLQNWKHVETESIVSKKTISLNTLLDEYNAPEYIDYISLDVEGAELSILKDFFIHNKRLIKIWTIEHSDEAEVKQLMQQNGFKLIGKIGADNIFELND